MALAAFADPGAVDPAVAETVDQVVSLPRLYSVQKDHFGAPPSSTPEWSRRPPRALLR